MIEYNEIELKEEDYKAAFTEVSFLFDVLASTVKDVIGNSAPLGVSAGRSMAKKLPVNLKEPKMNAVFDVLKKHFEDGFEFTGDVAEEGGALQVGTCMIRDICKNQNAEVGGEMCKMFHSYLGGMVAQLSGRQARVTHSEAGERCSLDVKVR
ncbi:MAG: hypothetical protein JXX29_17680 [Deltaproteobacteria bacterium]|nr:hypothetical protein [Deltaproteobacteria bacterium]MBN2673516.1 hypothetical protein [Deltaproteobacteria bacterium]